MNCWSCSLVLGCYCNVKTNVQWTRVKGSESTIYRIQTIGEICRAKEKEFCSHQTFVERKSCRFEKERDRIILWQCITSQFWILVGIEWFNLHRKILVKDLTAYSVDLMLIMHNGYWGFLQAYILKTSLNTPDNCIVWPWQCQENLICSMDKIINIFL